MVSRTSNAAAAILALWCTCVSYGSPIPAPNGKEMNISRLVFALATNCSDNPLLADKLTENLAVCANSDVKTRLKCLSFLDINRRLCALSRPGFNLTERIRAEASKHISVDALCANEDSFTMGSLPEFPTYAESIKKVLTVRERCLKLCFSDSIMDDDPDYFCKVLHYGSNIIKDLRAEIEHANIKDHNPLQLGPATSATVVPPVAPAGDVKVEGDSVVSEVTIKTETPVTKPKISNELPIIKTVTEKHTDSEVNHKTESNGVEPLVPNSTGKKYDTAVVPAEPNSTKVNLHPAEEKPMLSEQTPVASPQMKESNKTPETNEPKPPTAEQEKSDVPQNHEQWGSGNENQIVTNTKITEKTVTSAQARPIVPVLSGDKPETGVSADQDDYDSQLPGDDAPILEDSNLDEEDRLAKKPQSSLPDSPSNERAFSSNIAAEDYLDEDDGHFFPLFFSAVGMMVLLYILYHNKNKIMGLLIEGRQQGGRRRNSRGHAYRRLDTLEQAISSNAPGATPSKIIY